MGNRIDMKIFSMKIKDTYIVKSGNDFNDFVKLHYCTDSTGLGGAFIEYKDGTLVKIDGDTFRELIKDY